MTTRSSANGEPVLSPAVVGHLVKTVRQPSKGLLTQREQEVLRLVADGATNRAAAAKPLISEASIKTHLLHVHAELEARDRAAAVGEAYRRDPLG